MRKTLFIFIILGMVLNGSFVFAENSPGKKLTRGFVNILTFPVEVPKQARTYWINGAQKTDHILIWIFSGAVTGMVDGVKRAGSGIWDIFSFPWSVPAGYEPLIKPDYVFQNWPRNPKSGR